MAQSLAKVYIHLIFSTKNREPVLADEWHDELFKVLGGTAKASGSFKFTRSRIRKNAG